MLPFFFQANGNTRTKSIVIKNSEITQLIETISHPNVVKEIEG